MSLDPLVLNFTETTYAEGSGDPKRYWPIDSYPVDKLGPIEEAAVDFLYLKVPLMGQHVAPEPSDFCGRTSASMAYNYHQLLEGGDPRERYISHWNGDDASWKIDLRLPNKDRAFHTIKTDKPGSYPSGYCPRRLVDSAYAADYPYGYTKHSLFDFPTADQGKRKARAAEVAGNELLIEQALAPVLGSLRAGHPVIAYTRLSHSAHRQHIVLFCGFFRLTDKEGDALWILVADPATGVSFHTHTAAPGKDPSKWSRKHCFYSVIGGNWNAAKGSLYLMRASFLYQDYTTVSNRYAEEVKAAGGKPHKYWKAPGSVDRKDTHRLVLDCNDAWGGKAYCSTKPLGLVPDGLIKQKHDFRPAEFRFITMPFKRGKAAIGPVDGYHANEIGHGGFFPLGVRRNLHSGVHLTPPPAEVRTQPAEGEEPAPPRPAWPAAVHALAPGYVVAARLPRYDAPGYQLLGNHLGFVVIRHELQPVNDEEEPPTHALYTMYMHLAPPGWEALEGDRYQQVGWFKQLSNLNHGQVVTANSPNHAPGECLWVAQDLTDTQASGKVPILQGGKEQEVDLGSGRAVCAVVRPAPADVSQALEGCGRGTWSPSRTPCWRSGRGRSWATSSRTRAAWRSPAGSSTGSCSRRPTPA